VVDVWKSEESFRQFDEMLTPILQAVGVEGAPGIFPANVFVSG
jgi:hypothetical protein